MLCWPSPSRLRRRPGQGAFAEMAVSLTEATHQTIATADGRCARRPRRLPPNRRGLHRLRPPPLGGPGARARRPSRSSTPTPTNAALAELRAPMNLQSVLAARPKSDLLIVGRSAALSLMCRQRLEQTEALINQAYELATGRPRRPAIRGAPLQIAPPPTISPPTPPSTASPMTSGGPCLPSGCGHQVGYMEADGLRLPAPSSSMAAAASSYDAEPLQWRSPHRDGGRKGPWALPAGIRLKHGQRAHRSPTSQSGPGRRRIRYPKRPSCCACRQRDEPALLGHADRRGDRRSGLRRAKCCRAYRRQDIAPAPSCSVMLTRRGGALVRPARRRLVPRPVAVNRASRERPGPPAHCAHVEARATA